uniref:Uncharacterized protein n=1 Tax=Nannospalax galili TaxID=1026970 RepID=A0A8C6QQJ5_NANGA
LPKRPKNLRLRNSPGSLLGHFHHPGESEDSSGLATSAEPSREEPGPAASSCPSEDTGAPSDLGPPEQESPSQETSPELGTYQAGSQLQEEALRLPRHEATPEVGTAPSDSGRASKDIWIGTIPPDVGSLGNNSPEAQKVCVPDSCGQERHLPNGNDEDREVDSRDPQQGDAQGGGAGAQQPREPQEGQGIPYTLASAPALDPTWYVTQDLPAPSQTLCGTVIEAASSHSSPGNTSLRENVITDVNSGLQQRALVVAGPLGSLSKRAPGRGYNRTFLGYTALAETTENQGEANLEDESCGDTVVSLAAILAVTPGKQPTVDTKGPGHLACEMALGVQTEDPGPDGQWLGGMQMLESQVQPMNQKTVELGSQNCQQDLEGLSLSPPTSLLEYSWAASGLSQGSGACHSSPRFPEEPAGQPPPVPDPPDRATLQESSAMELDFLPDSQIQDALNTPDLEAFFPAENVPGLGWPDPRPCATGEDPVGVAKAQPRPLLGTQAQEEVCQMQDATDTVRGLVVELSNLNRLIMSTHRDLEAFKRRRRLPLPWGRRSEGT